MFPDFLRMGILLRVHTWNSSRLRSNRFWLQCTGFTVPTISEKPHGSPLLWACQWLLSQPLSSPQLYHNDSLELREWPKVTGSKVWTVGRLRNCLDAHLGQIVCDKDGFGDWCIVLVERLLSRFEECWPLPTESLPEHPYNLNIVTLTLTLWSINSDVLTSLLLPNISSSLTDSLPSLNISWHSKTDARFIARQTKSSLKHSNVSMVFFSKFKTECYCISFF